MSNLHPQLLIGRAGAGKTTHCLDIFCRQLAKSLNSGLDHPAYFILPNEEHKERIRELILRDRRLRGLLNVHVLTIHDFIRYRVRKAEKSLSHFERTWLICDLLETHDFPWLKSNLPSRQLAPLLADYIREFKSNRVSANVLRKQAHDDYFKIKARDLASLLEHYDAACVARGIVDPEDEILNFAQQLKPAGTVHELIIFDGFFSFTETQLAFLGAVAKTTRQTIVTLTLSADSGTRPCFYYPAETKRRLLNMGFQVRHLSTASQRFSTPDLQHLEAKLFKTPVEEATQIASRVQCLAAAYRLQAIEMIAREIWALRVKHAYHWSDFMLVLRNVEAYRCEIEEVFKAFDVPYEIHERKRLNENAFIRYLLLWMNIFVVHEGQSWQINPQRLLDFLKSPYPSFNSDFVNVLEMHLLACEGPLTSEDLLATLASLPKSMQADMPLRQYLESFLAIQNYSDLCNFYRKFIESMLQTRTLSAEEVRGLEKWNAILEELLGFAANSANFSVQIHSRLMAYLDMGLYSDPKRGKNRVQVYDVSLALQKEYKNVFIVGLNQGQFPKAWDESVLLKDRERSSFNKPNPVLDTQSMRFDGERYFFYMAATRARDRLYLSWVESGLEGQKELRSCFVDEVLRLFKVVPIQKLALADHAPLQVSWHPRDVLKNLYLAKGKRDSIEFMKRCALTLSDRIRTYYNLPAGPEGLKTLIQNSESRPQPIQNPNNLDLFREKQDFSVSEIATLSNCAYQHFAKYVLRLEAQDHTRVAVQDGQILHRVLELIYREDWDYHISLTWSQLEQKLTERLEQVFGEFPASGEHRHESAWRKRNLKRALMNYLREEYSTRQKEQVTHSESEWKFTLKRGAIRIRGRIDRVDVDNENKARVVDYKSGSTQISNYAEWRRGDVLESSLYLSAIRASSPWEPIGIEYVALKKPVPERKTLTLSPRKETSRSLMSTQAFDEMLKQAESKTDRLVQDFHKAKIPARAKSCAHCDYYGLCRFEGWRLNQ